MKGKIFLFLFLIFVMLVSIVFADEEDNFLNDLRQKRESEQKAREMLQQVEASQRGARASRIYLYKDTIRIYGELKIKAEQNCLPYEDKLMLQVQYGRYISAFEMCRQQGKGVQECIQKVQEAKEKWRARCKNADASLRLMYYTAKLRAEEVKNSLENLRNKVNACIQAEMSTGLAALAHREVCAFQSQLLSKWYPGTEFSLQSGTGKVVASDAVFYYQGWIFVRGDWQIGGGLLLQIFDNRMNFAADGYNIAVNFKMQGDWEIVGFNLPFDSQTEQVLLSNLGRGVRLTNKEIIDLVNAYLHDTVWEVDLPLTFQKLLFEAGERRFFIESLLEYYAYDTYLKKVLAEETRLKQQLKEREQEQEQEPQQKQKTKKSRGTRK
jgi:hypothetical protein